LHLGQTKYSYEDIEINKDGRGYAILLRNEGYDTNSIFESDKIGKISEDTYVIHGYFKDALLVVQCKGRNPSMYGSYMDYDI
jgi:hypothetical protein